MTNSCDSSEGTLVVTHADQDWLMDSLAMKRTGPAVKSKCKFLRRQTHLHLQSRGLVGYLAGCLYDLVPKVEVIYAQDNALTHVPAIASLRNLTMLYLQDNNLATTMDLKHLTALRKLDLEGNALHSLPGLSSLTNLTDLHISRQRLPPGCSVEVESDVLQALSVTLVVLRAASCGMHSISCFGVMQRLQLADFSDNELANEDDCFFFVESIACLQRLDVRGNRICQAAKFMDQVVVRGENLLELNGKDVKPNTRDFLRRKGKLRAASGRIPSVEEARQHAGSRVAQLRIESPVSFNAKHGLSSRCTPPSARTPEDLKAAGDSPHTKP